jgi:cobalt-zinc-cadmium efflux system protein
MSAHHTHHTHPHERGGRALAGALALTVVYAVIELAGGLWSGSLALVSDAGHMFSDAAALAIAGLAAWLARRPPGDRHSYGWQRAEVIGALLNSLLMLGVIVVLVAEAVQRLLAPRPVIAGGVIVIAFAGLLVNATVALMLSRSAASLNTRAAMVHVIGDLLSSVMAVIAGAVIYVTGWLPVDPILSIVIAALILMTTLRLLRDTLHVLMEGVPPSVELAEIGGALARVPGVVSVHDLHVWSITPGRVALSAHLELVELVRWPEILETARLLLDDRFGIDHVTLQPERRRETRPETAVIRLWRGNSMPPPGIS